MPRSWRSYVLNATGALNATARRKVSGISYTISEGRYFLQNLRTIYKIYVSPYIDCMRSDMAAAQINQFL